MTNIKSLKDKNGDSFFPVTHIDAIFDSDGKRGELVQAKEIIDVIDFSLEDNIINRVNNIENDLNKTENIKYATKNGVKKFNCKNGYIDNIYMEGETLVNLCYFPDVPDATAYSWYQRFDNRITGYDTYTILIPKTAGHIGFEVYNTNNVGTNYAFVVDHNVGFKVVNIPKDHRIATIYGSKDTFTEDAFKEIVKKTIIIAGDHSGKPIGYFEGVKSRGQGDKIDIVSCTDNIYSDTNKIVGKILAGEGVLVDYPTHDCSDYIVIEPNSIYYTNISHGFVVYDANKNIIDNKVIVSMSSVNGKYIMPNNAKYLRINLDKDTSNYFITKKYDKKQISATLRSLPNGVKDTIEKRDNKYYLVKRCEEYVYTGENFNYYAFNDAIHHVGILLNDVKIYDDVGIFSVVNNLIPHHSIGSSHFRLFIDNYQSLNIILPISDHKSDLDIKEYLKSNNFTVVYELATPQIIELPNFNPQTYEGDTILFLSTGAILSDCEFEVTNSKGSEIEVLKNKVSDLDNNYSYDYKITPLNGWQLNQATITRSGNHVQINMILIVQGVHTPSSKIATFPPSLKPKTVVICNLMDISGTPIGAIEIVNNYIQVNGTFSLIETHHGCCASFSYYI